MTVSASFRREACRRVKHPQQCLWRSPVRSQVPERPEGFEHLGGMGRETDPVTTCNQFEDNQKQRLDGAGMEAHFKLFEYNPLDLACDGRALRRKHQPIETEQERHELALACGPDHEGQRLLSRLEHEPHLHELGFQNQFELCEDVLLEQASELFIQPPLLWEQCPANFELLP